MKSLSPEELSFMVIQAVHKNSTVDELLNQLKDAGEFVISFVKKNFETELLKYVKSNIKKEMTKLVSSGRTEFIKEAREKLTLGSRFFTDWMIRLTKNEIGYDDKRVAGWADDLSRFYNLLENRFVPLDPERVLKNLIVEWFEAGEMSLKIWNQWKAWFSTRISLETLRKISLIKEDLEEMMENKEAEQVDIIARHVLHIDSDLTGDLWMSKNISVVANKVNIWNKHTINVSGKSQVNSRERKARDGADGRNGKSGEAGEDGKDGNTGESSGNVLIIAKEMTNPEFLTIKLMGGNGENGESGGKGGNGENGAGITKADFDELFPSYDSIYRSPWETFKDYHPGGSWKKTFDSSDSSNMYVFYEFEDNCGRKIYYTYGADIGVIYNWYEVVFWVKGTDGTSGGIGGLNGRGGEGGNQGECTVMNPDTGQEYPVKKDQRNGNPGKDGKVGGCGKSGENGNDIACIDRSAIGSNKHYYGESKNSRLTLKYYTKTDHERRINRYRKIVERQSACYGEFSYGSTPQGGLMKKQKQKKEERSSEAQMTMKKSIVLGEVMQKAQKHKAIMDDVMEAALNFMKFLVSQIRNLKIEIYGQEQYGSVRLIETYPGEKLVQLYFDGNQFLDIVPDQDLKKLSFARKPTQWDGIFSENNERINKIEWNYSHQSDKDAFVGYFPSSFSDTVVEWVDCYLAIAKNGSTFLKMLHERFEVDGNHLEVMDFQFVISTIILLQSEFQVEEEFILNLASSIPQSKFTVEKQIYIEVGEDIKKLGNIGYYIMYLKQHKIPRVDLLEQLLANTQKKYHVPQKLIAQVCALITNKEVIIDEDYIRALDEVLAKMTKKFGDTRIGQHVLVTNEIEQTTMIKEVRCLEAYKKVISCKDRDLDVIADLIEDIHDGNSEIDTSPQSIAQILRNPDNRINRILNKIDKRISRLRGGIRLRDTQKMAIVYAVENGKNLLSQVNTGEGKSYIVAAIAIIRAKVSKYKFVDIITSSPVLAQRDATEMRDIYEAMGLSVNHNCDEDTEKRK
ncbi:hypothetical protein FO519_009483, partial [Halicephalobus sp. NKZ332]